MTFYFGDEESTNFVIEARGVVFNVHWEVLCSAMSYFKKMQSSRMSEFAENRAKFNDDSAVWAALLSRIYPPSRRLSLEQAAFILPLVSYLRIDFLVEEIAEVGMDVQHTLCRTPSIGDIYCRFDLAHVPASWFKETSEWSYTNSRRFVDESNSVEIVRAASALFVAVIQEILTIDYRNEIKTSRSVVDTLKKRWSPAFPA